jgi:hypothetical protein
LPAPPAQTKKKQSKTEQNSPISPQNLAPRPFSAATTGFPTPKIRRQRRSRFSARLSNDSLSIAIRAMEEIMAAKVPSVKRYVVRLSAEERQQLEAAILCDSHYG